MLRDKRGRFFKGNQGFWLGKERPEMRGENNPRWSGGKQYKHCLTCQRSFEVRGKRKVYGKFCSQSCKGKWQFLGERNPRWNGGVEREQRDQDPRYVEWRKKVYERDGWTCLVCKGHKKNLIAHHLKVWKYFPKERFKVENGITLCRPCHCKLHTLNRDVIDFRGILRDYTFGSERR